jgi:formylglycine-generating enzyme required for sulfatase activity
MKKIVVFLFILIMGSGLWAQQKYALVIGNSDYKGISTLKNPVNDANDMEAALKSLGFTVEKVMNGNLEQMENAVANLKRRLGGTPTSYGFFFYAGHGVQANGENYLIPVEADNIQNDTHLRQRAVSLQFVLDSLNEAGNQLNMVVLDACRDNPFRWARSGSRGLSVVSQVPRGSIVMYATGANSVASDGTARNGLFTGHLLSNLKTTELSVFEVFDKTMGDVSRVTGGKQEPELSLRFSGAHTVYLGTRPSTPAPTPAPQPAPVVTPAAPPVQPAPVVTPAAPPVQPASDNMVRIKGGTFTMGSPTSEPDHDNNETPHQVKVKSFYMGKYEVTQKEYQEVMGTNPSNFKGENLPVEQVSWYDAVEYCNKRSEREGFSPAYTIDKSRSDPNNKSEKDTVRWVVTWNKNANGYRLPTEAEWEYACRAGTTTPFNTGNNITTGNANYDGNNPYNNNAKGTFRKKTTAVGSFAPNPWGLYDMHGNVLEWCWDWYGSYSSSVQTDPVGASSGSTRVFRGGSWNFSGRRLRSAHRVNFNPSYRDNDVGFRLVRP